MKYKLIFLFIIFFNFCDGAITFKGMVVCSESDEPLQYVNIGIPLCNVGTMTDSKGNFSIDIDSSLNNYKVLFSCVGYEDTLLFVNKLKKIDTIQMNPIVYKVEDVNVKHHKMYPRSIGYLPSRSSNSIFSLGGDSSTIIGAQVGAFIRNKTYVVIKSLKFAVVESSYDSILLKINVYEVKRRLKSKKISRNTIKSIRKRQDGNLSWEEIEGYRKELGGNEKFLGHKPILVYVDQLDIDFGLVEVDLTEYNLATEENILVSIEVAEYIEGGEFKIAGTLKRRRGFLRRCSHALWKELPFVPSFILNVSSRKKIFLK